VENHNIWLIADLAETVGMRQWASFLGWRRQPKNLPLPLTCRRKNALRKLEFRSGFVRGFGPDRKAVDPKLFLLQVLGQGFHFVFDLHFLADVFDVGADGFGGDVELFTDLLVDVTCRQHIQNFTFPR